MKASTKRGFTLIELLVVIAIIGILAGIVLASLSSARSGASDAKIKEQLNNMRAQAELYTGTPSNIGTSATCPDPTNAGSNMFGPAGLGPLLGGITLTNTHCSANNILPKDGGQWAVSAQLSKTGEFWCVDYTGAALQTAAFHSGFTCQ